MRIPLANEAKSLNIKMEFIEGNEKQGGQLPHEEISKSIQLSQLKSLLITSLNKGFDLAYNQGGERIAGERTAGPSA